MGKAVLSTTYPPFAFDVDLFKIAIFWIIAHQLVNERPFWPPYVYITNQLTFTYSMSTIETLEKGVKYIKSEQ